MRLFKFLKKTNKNKSELTETKCLLTTNDEKNDKKNDEKNEKNDEKDGDHCIICFEQVKEEQCIKCNTCKKMSHQKCIQPWVKAGNGCPTCRGSVDLKKVDNKKEITELDSETLMIVCRYAMALHERLDKE